MVGIVWFVIGMTACAAAPQVDADVTAADWLTQIERKTEQVHALRAKVVYIREQGVLGDVQHRYGFLVYQAGPPAKFAISFDRIAVSGAVRPMDKTYVFDGRYMAERDGDEKIYSRWELVREGEEADLLALGEGPFALPLNLKKDAVLERFDVELLDDGENKPVHLGLTPKPGAAMEVTRIELWFDRQTLLPVGARSINEESENVTHIRLTDAAVNPDDLNDSAFDTAAPQEAGWQINETPLEEATD